MTNLQKIIDSAEDICKNLEIEADFDKKYPFDLCLELERYSWQMHRMANDIRQLQEMFGV